MIEKKARELEEILKKNAGKKFLLVSHTPPCPDSVASLLVMEKICKHYNIKAEKYMVKSAMLPENVAILNKLDLKIDYMVNGGADAKKYDKIVFLDCVPGASNVPQINKTNFNDDLVIDHHELKQGKKIKGEFIDIRQDVGSTSTILAHYLKELNLLKKDEDAALATLLYRGIRIDTEKFKLGKVKSLDSIAFFLEPFCLRGMIDAVSERKIAKEDRAIFKEVYDDTSKERFEKNGYLFIDAGKVPGIQSLAKAAECALGMEDISLSLIVGLNPGGEIVGSSRSDDPAKSSVDLVTYLFGNKYGGGTWSSAAATFPLKTKLEEEVNDIPLMKGSDVEDEYKGKIRNLRRNFEEYIEPKKKRIKTEEPSTPKKEKKKSKKTGKS